MAAKIQIVNKKAGFEYELDQYFVAGIQLTGTEIKSLRMGRASLNEAYCYFKKGELWVKMHIAEYPFGNLNNHDPKRHRKLLLHKHELAKLEAKVKTKGTTIVPIRIFIADNRFAKIEIATAHGKRKYDKRETTKLKDAKRDLDREFKL